MPAAPYIALAALRERLPDLTDISDARMTSMVTEFEEIAEDYCGVAFTPRTNTETIEGCLTGRLMLSKPKVRSITTLTVDGVAVTSGNRTLVDPLSGIVTWTGSREAPAVVVYSHGFDAPPTRLVRACVEYVNRTLNAEESGASRDVLTQGFADGGMTRYSTPDKTAGRPTGWLEVDRLLNSLPRFQIPGAA